MAAAPVAMQADGGQGCPVRVVAERRVPRLRASVYGAITPAAAKYEKLISLAAERTGCRVALLCRHRAAYGGNNHVDLVRQRTPP